MHGGDIYRNNIHFDFSINLNPLGVPSEVQWVLTEAALHANKYPDISHMQLVSDTARIFDVLEDEVVYGNGASELIMAICHATVPKKAMLVTPCFSGYEHCILGASPNCRIVYHHLLEENDFKLQDDIINKIAEEKPQIMFLTNPNNPNGGLIEMDLLKKIVEVCEKTGTMLIVDECFLPLTGREKELSLAYDARNYKSLIVLRAFTKTYAIPGVRIGYAICSKATIAQKIKSHLPEWNLSIFAQMAGVQCLRQLDYIEESVRLINDEKKYLIAGLKELGFKVYPSDANYILFKSNITDLKKKLIEYSILIRDCSDYEGLSIGFYRIAVKSHNENSGLLSALESIVNG